MEHTYAAEHRIVEQYLLNELSPDMRDEFEAHFFDCQECAADLRATDAFLKAARTELQRAPEIVKAQSGPTLVVRNPPRNLLQWKPAFALTALAACLVVMVYQNTVTFPRLRSEVASVEAPALLPTLSLVGGNSRGGNVPTANLNGLKEVALQFDIPAQDRFSKYICSLYTPQHQLIGTVQVSPEKAKDLVSIQVPLGSNPGGTYSLEVQGNQESDGQSAGVVLATYTFTLNAGNAGAGH